MRKIEDFLNSKNTFFKVLDVLKNHGDISSIGDSFIAGGSVANTIYHLIYGGDLIINDIDVYHRVENKKNDNDQCSSVFINEEGLEIIDDHYGRTYVSETGARMRVVKHSRNGIFNDIDYFYDDSYKTEFKKIKQKENVIIEGFDLNCCEVGLDIVNGKIIYTPEFVKFLKTKQLRVTNPCSPIQTTIRVYKKLQDLKGVFCDIKHEIRFLTIATKYLYVSQITRIIGPETKVKYDKYKNFVENYFVLRELKNLDELPYELKEKHPTLESCKNIIWTYDRVLDFDILEDVGSINKLKKIWSLLYTYKKKSEQDKINKIFYKNVFLGDMAEDTWSRREYKKNHDFFDTNPIPLIQQDRSGDYVEVPYYNSARFTYMMILSKNNYYKCNFNIKHVDYIDKLISEHHGLTFILKICDTITEQYSIAKFIKSLANKEGDWVIGLLENINWSKYKHEFETNAGGKLTKEFISTILESEKTINSSPLTEKVNLSEFEYKTCVKEFITTVDLMVEGKKMGHCVGGYSSAIKSGYSRIFHIDCDGIGSTIEVLLPSTERWSKKVRNVLKIKEVHQSDIPNTCVVFYEDNTNEEVNVGEVAYRKSQHFGRYPEKGNLEPTENNKNVANALLGFLNKNCLPQNFKIKWSNNFACEEEELIFV